MVKAILALSAIVVLILSSCYYHKEDALYPLSSCDTTNVTYSKTIKDILNRNECLGCHIGSGAPGGIRLDSYANVKILADSVYKAITHAPNFKPMPDNGLKMAPCDIYKVKAWINAGTPN